MATHSLKLPGNAPGAFYVTSECIDCDMCRSIAPAIYRSDDAGEYTIVARQPENGEETRLAIEGLEGGPVEAIGVEK